VESEEDKKLMTTVAAESIVLLKNDKGLLPLTFGRTKKIAIVGGNAKASVLSGGGSAALKPSYFISPYDGLVNALPKDVQVTYGEGARAYLTLPVLDNDLVTASGERGWVAEWFSHEDDESMVPLPTPIASRLVDETRIFISASTPERITRRWKMKLSGKLRPRNVAMKFEFGLISAGRAKVSPPLLDTKS
jgi:beta-glucosidase